LLMLKAQPESAVAEYEKMPFEVAPFMVYLTRQGGKATVSDSGAVAVQTDAMPESLPLINKPQD
jgi:hypothetical protein